MTAPRVVVLAGPNGAGKTMVSRSLVCDELGIRSFVNADTIARGLACFDPETAARPAARIMVQRLRTLAAARADFAFESNLASQSLAPWLRGLRVDGYRLLLAFLWLPTAEMVIARVRQRVHEGGHFVPDEVVKRRHARGMVNLRQTFLPMADAVWLFDGSCMPPRLVAAGVPTALTILEPRLLRLICGDDA